VKFRVYHHQKVCCNVSLERNGTPKAVDTLLIDLFSILAALTARKTLSGAMFVVSDFLLHDLGIIMFPKTKLK
jgi:hypothetical protein